jgi:aromatic ring-opening dioxygenase catalytic subunit (LigB family)
MLLADAGIETEEDSRRDFDHGVFIPLKVSFPQATIPILQLSLQSGLDPAEHLAVGRAIRPVRDDNIAIIGSGLSFHNLGALGNPAMDEPAAVFDQWLTKTLCESSPAERASGLRNWLAAPHARACHPREEHLLPLMVTAGAAGDDPGHHVFSGRIWGKAVSGYHFN